MVRSSRFIVQKLTGQWVFELVGFLLWGDTVIIFPCSGCNPKLKLDSLKRVFIGFQRLMRTKKSRGTVFYHFIKFNKPWSLLKKMSETSEMLGTKEHLIEDILEMLYNPISPRYEMVLLVKPISHARRSTFTGVYRCGVPQ